MSIINTFDGDGAEIINPRLAVERIEGFPETVVAVFSYKFADLVQNTMSPEQISWMAAGRVIPIYKIEYKGKAFGFYHTLLGGAASAALLEEVLAKGAKKVLFFGSCGSLDNAVTGGNFIVPTHAYRDEGTSYHYAGAGDYIKVETADRLACIFDGLKVPYIKAKTWTTDSFYRETKKNMTARKQDGCVAVEMECASVMAAGQFRQAEVYEFLYAADCLNIDNWDRRILGNMPADMRRRILTVALETALML